MRWGQVDPEARARRERVARLREGGESYAQIGEALGISASRANQLYAEALRNRAEPPVVALADLTLDTPVDRLPIGLAGRRVLSPSPYATLGDLLALERASFCPVYLALPNAGRRTWNELVALLEAYEVRGASLGH